MLHRSPTRSGTPFVRAALVALACGLASGVLTGCSGDASETANATGGAAGGRGGRGGRAGTPPVPVEIAQVVEQPMAVVVRAVGNVEASSTVDVRSQVSGTLLNVGFKEGDDVTEGQLLFTLDSRSFEATLKQAEATLARDTAQAKGVSMQLARSEELLGRGLVARSERDALATQLSVVQASIAADTAQVENARLQLQYTRIVAPVSGRTGALMVHPGSLVRANDAAPLVVINRVVPASVSFAVPARLLPQLRRDRTQGPLKALAAPAGSRDTPAAGSVDFIDNAVDPATDTIRIKAAFPNHDRRLWPGAFVDVTLQLSVTPKAIVVPNAAVQASQQGQFVYVVKEDSTVEARPLKVAWVDGNQVVVESGVKAGETVVTDGQLRLTPGARVSVKPAEGQRRTAS